MLFEWEWSLYLTNETFISLFNLFNRFFKFQRKFLSADEPDDSKLIPRIYNSGPRVRPIIKGKR